MKFLPFLLLCLMAVPALADDVTIVQGGNERVVRDLPGNAQIVTGNRDTVVIENDDSIVRHMLLGPRVRVYGGNNGVSSVCPPTLSTSDRNRCLRDYSKAQEKIRKRYND